MTQTTDPKAGTSHTGRANPHRWCDSDTVSRLRAVKQRVDPDQVIRGDHPWAEAPGATLSFHPGGRGSAAGELAVGGAVGARCFGAEAGDLVLLVGLEVALEPEPLGVALVGQDVGGHAVEEPAVV
jgi:hypothetical protein